MRKLMNFCAAAAFSVFLFSVCRLYVSEALAVFAALLPVPFAAFLSFKLRRTGVFSGVCFALVFVILFSLLILSPAGKLCGSKASAAVRVYSYAEGKTSYGKAEGRLLSVNGKRTLPFKVTVILKDGSPDGVVPGCLVTLFADLKKTSNKSDMQKGALITLTELNDFSVKEEKGDIFCALARLSHKISKRIETLFDGDGGALLSALLCGDKSRISKDLKASLYKSGLSHVVAVSGLHVSIILAVLMTLFGKKAGVILAIPLLPAYAILTGGSPSVLRASVMSLFLIAAFLFDARYDRLTALSFSALLIGVLSPFSLCSASFLLSFSATLGIILFAESISAAMPFKAKNRALNAVLSFLVSTLSVTLSALIFTLPVSVVFFESVSLVSVITNPLVLWAVAPAMLCGAFTVLFSYFLPFLSGVFGIIASLFLKYILLIVKLFGKLSLTARTDDLFTLLFCVFLIALAVLFYKKILTPKQSLAAGLCLFLLSFGASYVKTLATYEINVFGDGGASSVVIYDGKSTLALGMPSSYGADYFFDGVLSRFGASRIDAAVLSGSGRKDAGNASLAENICAPGGVYGENVYRFEEGGSFTFGKTRCAVFKCGESYALWAKAGKIAVADVCSVYPYEYAAAPFSAPCDILVVSARWMNSPKYLSALCSRLRPSLVLVADSRYDDVYPDREICGCEVRLLSEADYYEIRYLK
ncbi:MAG: ComEC/Rec2 family competence protein [Clostridia bacterium]|nr:ComEC/Rec2 family competence protein [Clostridia bacterium]